MVNFLQTKTTIPMNIQKNYEYSYGESRTRNTSEEWKGKLVLASPLLIFILWALISSLSGCSKAELPVPKVSSEKEKVASVTPKTASLLAYGSDTVKARFWIANDSGNCRLRQLTVGPNNTTDTTTYTTAAVQINGDYIVYLGSGEMIDVTTTAGQTVRTMHLFVEKLGGDTIRITLNDLLQINAPNAQTVNANTFLVSASQAQLFQVIALPPVLSSAVNASTNSQ